MADLDRVLRHDQLNRRPRAGFIRVSGRPLGRELRLGDLQNRSKGPVHRRRIRERSGDIVFEEHHIRARLIRRVMLPAYGPGEVVLGAEFVGLTSFWLSHMFCVLWARLFARG